MFSHVIAIVKTFQIGFLKNPTDFRQQNGFVDYSG